MRACVAARLAVAAAACWPPAAGRAAGRRRPVPARRQRGARHRARSPDTTLDQGPDPAAAPRSTRCCADTAWPTTRRVGVVQRRARRCSTRAGCGRCSRSRSSARSRARSGSSSTRSTPTRFLRVDAGRRRRRRRWTAERRADPARRSSTRPRPDASTATRRRSSRRWTPPAKATELAVDLAGIFSGEVDFNSELQPGDGFALAFERYTREGGAVDLRRHHGGRVPQRRPRAARDPLHAARRQARLLRRGAAARCGGSSCARR